MTERITVFIKTHKAQIICALSALVLACAIATAVRIADTAQRDLAGDGSTSTQSTEMLNSDVGSSETPSEAEPDADGTGEPEREDTEMSEDTSAESESDAGETSDVTETAPVHVGVTGITLSTYDVYLTVGQTQMPLVTMYPENSSDKGEAWLSTDTGVAVVDVYGNITGVAAGTCTVTVTSTDNGSVTASVNVSVTAPETEQTTQAQSTASPTPTLTYINGILVVNKTYALPEDYNPGADPTAYAALLEMFAAAQSEGLSLWVKSGFRSYSDQKWQYNYYAERDGASLADTYSARPGHSEHQSGLAFDLNSLYKSFGATPEGMWLAANCHKYGFIIRYPEGKEHLTGYMYEPWHVRYLGVDTATAVYESGLCLEEYLGITSVYQ